MSTRLLSRQSKPWQPRKYQKKAVKWLLEHAASGLFLEPGLGKTSSALAALKFLIRKGVARKVLIVAPLRVVYSVWPREVEKWADFQNLTYTILHGKDRAANLKKDVNLYLINPEGLDWLLGVTREKLDNGKTRVTANTKVFKSYGFDTLIIDELSKFKHPSTNRFKAIKQVLGTFARRWGLTGSPAANGLLDLFGQCYILDQGNALGPYITHYRNKYFIKGFDGFTWHLQEGADKAIYKRLKPLVLSMRASDHLDMPELVENDIIVDLPPKAMAAYRKVERELFAEIDAGNIIAVNAGAASSKCRQIASGAVYLEEDGDLARPEKKWAAIHSAKVEALSELIDELQGSPLLVAYVFEHDLRCIQKALGKDIPYIGGGVPAKRSDELAEAWNAGELPVLLGHPQAIGHGLNLQEAGHHIAWFTPTYNFELYDQYIRRILRQGSKAKTVFSHRIIARGTVDHAVIEALKIKGDGQASLFDALKSMRAGRGKE